MIKTISFLIVLFLAVFVVVFGVSLVKDIIKLVKQRKDKSKGKGGE